jgi:choline-glycine betaine transporter
MNFLVPLAALLGFELETMKDRLQRTIFGNAIMVVLSLIGIGFLLAAAFLALAAITGAIYSALIFAAVFLVCAFGLHLSLKASAAKERRAAAAKRHSGETSAFVTTAALTALPVLLRSPLARTVGIPAAAIAALLLFRSKRD